jgi:hypothetical protein
MKYTLSGTVALAFHHDFPFIPIHSFHLHTTIYPSLTNLISHYFTSRNITAFQFTRYFLICTKLLLYLMYHFANRFRKIAWGTGESP